MSKSMPRNDIKTKGYVLRRTNYGEADRILNLITPVGKISVIAKGVRKEKSKLAGGIELFTLSNFVIHQGQSELGILTSVKMERHLGKIVSDYQKLELASLILKQISKLADSSENEEFFAITDQSLVGLNDGVDVRLVEAWVLLNLKKAIGEEINLYRDNNGRKLEQNKRYDWNARESVFYESENGEYGSNEIKMCRLIYTTGLKVVEKVKVDNELLNKALNFARQVGVV